MTMEIDNLNCPQYFCFLSESPGSSDAFFDADLPPSENDTNQEQAVLNVCVLDAEQPMSENETSIKQKEITPVSISKSSYGKENQELHLEAEVFKSDSSFLPELDEEIYKSPYDLRLTPARTKRRGTGAFSSQFSSNRKSKKRIFSSSGGGDILKELSFDSVVNSVTPPKHNSEIIATTVACSSKDLSILREAEVESAIESNVADTTQGPENFPVQHSKKVAESSTTVVRTSRSRPQLNVQESSIPLDFMKTGTKMKPVRFVKTKKRKREDVEGHLPLAEQVAAFQNKTPKRFHTSANKVYQPLKHWSPQRVVPHSPILLAGTRKRCRTVLSQEELEEKEFQEMKQYKFHAKPVGHNVKIASHKVHHKSATKPKNIRLHTAERLALQYRHVEPEEKYEFHALPLPKNILNGPVGIKEKKVIPSTVPESPAFALKLRSQKWESVNKLAESPEKVFKFTACRPPSARSQFSVKYEKRVTEVQPFSFDAKDKERYERRDMKIQSEIEKENSRINFRAQPLPSPLPSKLPQVPRKEATVPIPFNLLLDNNSNKRIKTLERLVEQQIPQFKAQPATVLKKQPFVPTKSVTELPVEDFTLHTDIRASERLKKKEIQQARDAELEKEYLKQQEEAAERDRLEIQELRKQLVHKAQPIRQYKPVEIKRSSAGVTEPKSPKFATDYRLQLRH